MQHLYNYHIVRWVIAAFAHLAAMLVLCLAPTVQATATDAIGLDFSLPDVGTSELEQDAIGAIPDYSSEMPFPQGDLGEDEFGSESQSTDELESEIFENDGFSSDELEENGLEGDEFTSEEFQTPFTYDDSDDIFTPLELPPAAEQAPIGESDESQSLAELPPPPPIPETDAAPLFPEIPDSPWLSELPPDPSAELQPEPLPEPVYPPSQRDYSRSLPELEFEPYDPYAHRLELPQSDGYNPNALEEQPATPPVLPEALPDTSPPPIEPNIEPDVERFWRETPNPVVGVANVLSTEQLRVFQEQLNLRQIQLTVEEQLNAIDLVSQTIAIPQALNTYLNHLQQAHAMGLRGSDAIVWTRTRSYLDLNPNAWNAPDLGNAIEQITLAQEVRVRAIALSINESELSISSNNSEDQEVFNLTQSQTMELNSDRLIQFDLS